MGKFFRRVFVRLLELAGMFAVFVGVVRLAWRLDPIEIRRALESSEAIARAFLDVQSPELLALVGLIAIAAGMILRDLEVMR